MIFSKGRTQGRDVTTCRPVLGERSVSVKSSSFRRNAVMKQLRRTADACEPIAPGVGQLQMHDLSRTFQPSLAPIFSIVSRISGVRNAVFVSEVTACATALRCGDLIQM